MATQEQSHLSYTDIKDRFLDYFRENGHLIIDGSGIVPLNDPTLLVINSGMAPLKPYFTGQEMPPAPRLANAQLCVRTTDIDSIGDETHGTSFTMLGNWSFGGYGKTGAIDLAMGLVEDGYGISRDRLLATTFEADASDDRVPSDAESYAAWQRYFPDNRIVPSPPEDNFWGPAGTSGPCGPCTELFYDRMPDLPIEEHDGHAVLVDQRHAEIWNAGVFMEFNLTPDGHIVPLGRLCVDAGAGLERFAMVMQGAASIHEIDQYQAAYDYIKGSLIDDRSTRIVFDHLKTAKLMIESGIIPGTNGAESVTRRLIRRAIGVLATHDIPLSTITAMFNATSDVSEPTPRQLISKDEAATIIDRERIGYERLLAQSLRFLNKISGNGVITGQQVFDAQTSRGVPLDLIKSYCSQHGIDFPEVEYAALMDKHRQLSRLKKGQS